MANQVIGQIETKPSLNQTKSLLFPNILSQRYYVKLLRQCKKKLIVCMYQISHKKLVNTLHWLCEKDIDIQLLVYCINQDTRQMSILQRILQSSLEKIKIAVYTNEKRLMHSKFCVIDDEIVLVGSANWTNFAFTKNFESVIMMHNIQRATEFTKYFYQIWNSSLLLSMKSMNFQLTPMNKLKRINNERKNTDKCSQMIESLIEIQPPIKQEEQKDDSDDIVCLIKFGSPNISILLNDQIATNGKIDELLSQNLIQKIDSEDDQQENEIEIFL